VKLPLDQSTVIQISNDKSMKEVLEHVCSKRAMDPQQHNVKLLLENGTIIAVDLELPLYHYVGWKELICENVKVPQVAHPESNISQPVG
jgi:hypothetical protein